MPANATKLLFICSRNQIRILTAEKLLAAVPGYEVRSAGTQPSARVRITPGLLRWADVIFYMEKSHLRKVRERFPEEVAGKREVTLHIADEYRFLEEDLLDELRSKLAEYVCFPDS